MAVSQPQTFRALLVEDNPINQKVAGLLLKRLGVESLVAANGEEALRCLAAERVDIVFMDRHMPVMDGLETTRRLRVKEQNNDSPELPIIALSADHSEEDRDLFLNSGMNDVLAKPLKVDALQTVLETYVAGYPA